MSGKRRGWTRFRSVTAKAQQSTAVKLAGRIQSKWSPPKPLEEATLLEQGFLCVLTRRLSRAQAESTIKNLREAFFDWNELRVAQVQEIVPHVVIDGHHTAEEVLVAAQGPGAEKVKGMFPNTQIFHIMKDAYGW